MSESQIKNWIELQDKSIKSSLEPVHKKEMGKLIRIDKITPKLFTPRMPVAFMNGENTSVPRICTSSTLLHCMCGYAFGRIQTDFWDGKLSKEEFYEPFKGGYEISELDYEYCIVPGKKLLPDAEETKERWLVNYNSDHVNIKPNRIGKIFVHQLSQQHHDNKSQIASSTFEFYIEILVDDFPLLENKYFNAGHYSLIVKPGLDEHALSNKYKKVEIISITEIDKAQYMASKKNGATLLSHQIENKPVIAGW